MRGEHPGVRGFVVLAVVASVVAAGSTAPTGSTITPGASHGGLVEGSAGAPVPLGTGTFLAAAEGPDGSATTADDELLLVTGAGSGGPVLAALPVPGIPDYSGRILRLSATRAVAIGAGPDLDWSTDDDVVHVLSGIGSSNTVTTTTVGGLDSRDGYAPTALSSTRFVLVSMGNDNAANTADDEVVLVDTTGDEGPLLAFLAAPRIPTSGRSRPVALSPTSFLVASNGPDGNQSTADDVIYLFDVSGTPSRTDITVPFLHNGTSRPVRVNATRALVAACGPNGSIGSADDVVWLLDDLGAGNTATAIPTGPLFDYGAGRPTPLADDLAVIATNGTDAVDRTDDDGIVVITGLGTTNTVTPLVTGAIDEDGQGRPVRFGPDSCAFSSAGPDDSTNTVDDEVILLTGVGAANTITRVTLTGLQGGITSAVVPVGPDSFLVMTGGADGNGGGGDDTLAVVTGALGTPVVDHVPFGAGDGFESSYGLGYVPHLLGGGAAVHQTAGVDTALGSADDGLRIVAGLPGNRGLVVRSAKIGFDAAKPEKGEKAVLKASLVLEDPAGIADDVTLSLGNASATIPASAFTARNGVWKYRAPKGDTGFVTSVVYSAKKGTLAVKAKGIGSGAGTTEDGHVAFAFECGEVFHGQVVVGTAYPGGIRYRAPK